MEEKKERSKPYTNMNHLHLLDLAAFFETEAEAYGEESAMYSNIIEGIDEYSATLAALLEHPAGKELIHIEDEFNYRLEAFLKPIDAVMNIMVDDLFHNFSEINMTTSEALMELPDYAAVMHLLPRDDERRYGYVYHAKGNSCGYIWPENDLQLLIQHIAAPEAEEQADLLNIAKERRDLLEIFRFEQEYLGKHNLRELLKAVRKARWSLSLALPLIIMDLHEGYSYYKLPRHIDPRDIINPILEVREERRLMQKFSFNDLSHESFLKMAQQFEDQQSDIEVINGKISEHLTKDLAEYTAVLNQFRESLQWSELQEQESIWYHECERLILSFKRSVESFDADDPRRWKIHEESDAYRSAKTLWDKLPHSPYDSIFHINRGDLITDNQWQVMRKEFTGFQADLMLRDIGADAIFNECLRANRTSEEIAGSIGTNGQKKLRELRVTRRRLTMVLNLIQHRIERQSETS